MYPQHEAKPAQKDGTLAGKIREHDTFSCTISLSNPIHILFPLCNCPFSPALWSGVMASWMMPLHRGVRQLGGLPCPRAPADPRHNRPTSHIMVPGPLRMGRAVLGQQGPYSDQGSLSRNILLDKYSWMTAKTIEGRSQQPAEGIHLPIRFDNYGCRKNESRQKSQVHISRD